MITTKSPANNETVILGGGCFWCLEAAYELIEGITSVESGYAGGDTPDPTYEQVCNGNTGHAEVVRISFNSQVISFTDVLEIFFAIHDPTTPNRQGNDVGTQYRSIIQCSNSGQVAGARAVIIRLDGEAVWDNPIVTEVVESTVIYGAEAEHQRYYRRNTGQAYCQVIISPKLAKLRSKFGERIKVEN
ncbi:peptide-methionine (S)-S-oxide reductase MsrA [Candidatus Neomarinimicrobiota bacterium]